MERVAATGTAGQQLLRASQNAPGRGAMYLALDVEHTSVALDMKPSVILTMVSTWQQHSPDTLQLLPHISASLVVQVRDDAFAQRDPLLAAVLANATPSPTKKKG